MKYFFNFIKNKKFIRSKYYSSLLSFHTMFLDDEGERREWIKPIMFSGGVGSIDDKDVEKVKVQTGTNIIFSIIWFLVK